jgi:hypothetical protein
MNQACFGESEGPGDPPERRRAQGRRRAEPRGVADFRIMGLLTDVLGGGSAEMLCSAAQVSPLSGIFRCIR